MGTFITCMVFLSMMMMIAPKSTEAAPKPKPTITCNQVVSSLSPCIDYVVGGGKPSSGCCNGVSGLWNSAHTKTDRQGICTCLQQAVRGISFTSYNLALVASLPSKCGVNIPFKISPSTNCQSLK